MLFLTLVLSATLALLGLSTSAPTAYGPGASAPLATVVNGTYKGLHDANYNQDWFLGIPYAQPPVGQGRLNFPRPLNSSFQGVRSAQQYSPVCVGYGPDQIGVPISEDCLYLNVFRPSGYEDQKLPVGVWIYGGGFAFGAGSAPQYNMSFILNNSVAIQKPIITVTLNYRLSGWGWLWSDEVQSAGVTNLGWRDTRLALAWIQENIAAFGGDPAKVTIWGESAGAGIVSLHSTAFGGRNDNLFRALISESGPPLQAGYIRHAYANAAYANVTRDTGCSTATDTLACLRSVSYDTLNTALNKTYMWTISVDGDIVETLSSIQLSQGKFTRTPMLIGTNSDEGTLFEPLGINTDTEFVALLTSLGVNNNATIQQFLQDYPNDPSQGLPATLPGPPNSTVGIQYKRETAFYTDYLFLAGRRYSNVAWTNNSVPSYAYRFNTLSNGYTIFQGVEHYTEVAYVFDNLMGLGNAVNPFANQPVSHQQVANLMSKAWVSFIHDLNPNGHCVPDVPQWPAYSNSKPQDFVFDANVSTLAYAEPDTFRSPGINLINQIDPTQFGR